MADARPTPSSEMSLMQHVVPPGPWSLRLAEQPASVTVDLAGAVLPASVPGTVHTDLLAAGQIPDPYLDLNEKELAWIGRCSWVYSTTLPAPDGLPTDERVDLVFTGLDTFATVSLGGV